MKVLNKNQKRRLSEDLTVVLLRGNGAPRSFRFSVAALNRTLTALGFTFAFALLACAVLLGLSLVRGISLPSLPERKAPPVAVAPEPAAPTGPTNFVEVPAPPAETVTPTESPAAPTAPAVAEETKKSGLWQQLKGAVNSPAPSGAPAANEGELQKEVEGLRKDVARLGSQLEGRKDAARGAAGAGLVQFFGPRSTLVAENESAMRIRNPRVVKEGSSRQIAVDFELHNVDPEQRQERGYIVVLAKTPDLLSSYPGAVFAPSQNILLDFTKGETFAVSRFRQARATFPAAPLEGKRVNFQILLFATDGRVLANLPVEDSR